MTTTVTAGATAAVAVAVTAGAAPGAVGRSVRPGSGARGRVTAVNRAAGPSMSRLFAGTAGETYGRTTAAAREAQ